MELFARDLVKRVSGYILAFCGVAVIILAASGRDAAAAGLLLGAATGFLNFRLLLASAAAVAGVKRGRRSAAKTILGFLARLSLAAAALLAGAAAPGINLFAVAAGLSTSLGLVIVSAVLARREKVGSTKK